MGLIVRFFTSQERKLLSYCAVLFNFLIQCKLFVLCRKVCRLSVECEAIEIRLFFRTILRNFVKLLSSSVELFVSFVGLYRTLFPVESFTVRLQPKCRDAKAEEKLPFGAYEERDLCDGRKESIAIIHARLKDWQRRRHSCTCLAGALISVNHVKAFKKQGRGRTAISCE